MSSWDPYIYIFPPAYFLIIGPFLLEKSLIQVLYKDSLIILPGTLPRWVWPVLPWQPAPVSRRLLERRGLCVVVKGEGLGWQAPPLCESRPLIGRPSCLSLPLCTPVARPVKEEQRPASNDEQPEEPRHHFKNISTCVIVYLFLHNGRTCSEVYLTPCKVETKLTIAQKEARLPWDWHSSLIGIIPHESTMS